MKVATITKALGILGLSFGLVSASTPRAEAFPWLIVGGVVTAGVVGYVIGKHSCGGGVGCAQAFPGYTGLKYRDASYGYRASAAVHRCQTKFKSFNPNTGLITRNGTQEPCPYLH